MKDFKDYPMDGRSFTKMDEEFRQYLANKGVRFSSHFTGKNKWDTDFGVAAMQGLFGTMGGAKHNRDNLIELPDPQYHEGIKALINQLITCIALRFLF